MGQKENPAPMREALLKAFGPEARKAPFIALSAAETIEQMLNAYASYCQTIKPSLTDVPRVLAQQRAAFAKEVSHRQIDALYGIFGRAYEQYAVLQQASGPMFGAVADHKKAFLSLLDQTNADWLGRFLEHHPLIVEAIGGFPNWVPRPNTSDA